MISKSFHTRKDEHDINAQFVTLMHDLKTAADNNLLMSSMITDVEFSEEKAMKFIDKLW